MGQLGYAPRRLLATVLCLGLALSPVLGETPLLPLPKLGVDRGNSGLWTLYMRGNDNVEVPLFAINPSTGFVAFSNILLAGIVQHVPNNAALRADTSYLYPVIRDGFATPGDGGGGTYNHGSCAGVADDGSRVAAADGKCWNIDWSSVRNVAAMPMFGCFGQARDCTNALKSALATGKSVYFPSGYYLVTAGVANPGASGHVPGVIVTTPDQLIYGDGRTRSKLDCRLRAAPGATNPCLTFAVSGGAGGPEMRDLYMGYGLLPDSTSASATAPYGPLIYMQDQPGTRLRRMRLERASTDVDLRGNAGQSAFDDIEFNCLATCWYDDGSLDSVHWSWTQFYPWDLTANQATQFYTRSVAFDIGRSDNFRITQGMSIGRLAFNFHVSVMPATAGTAAIGSIDHYDCDTNSCLKMSAGQVEASGLLSTLGNRGSYTANVSGGILDLVGLQIGIGSVLNQPAFLVAGDGTNGVPRVTVNGGSTTYFGTQASQFDVTAFQTGTAGRTANAELTLMGHRFNTIPGTPSLPTCNRHAVVNKFAGRVTIVGVRMADLGSAGGGNCPNTFINIPRDGFDRVLGNVGPGWTSSCPASPSKGVYQCS